MSVHLVGGGRDLGAAVIVYGEFVAECVGRATAAGRSSPRVAVVVVTEADGHAEGVDWFRQALRRCAPVDVVGVSASPGAPLALDDGAAPTEPWWSGLDGLLVGGGVTPDYHRALLPYAGVIRTAVADGLPYAGFSAGAMIAAARALLGGWQVGTTAVTHEDNAEDLDQVTVVDGLGLVAATIEVHTAQWGTLSRLVAAVDTGAAAAGIAVDENTVVILDPTADEAAGPGTAAVAGAGQAWFVTGDGDGVRVLRRSAARSRSHPSGLRARSG